MQNQTHLAEIREIKDSVLKCHKSLTTKETTIEPTIVISPVKRKEHSPPVEAMARPQSAKRKRDSNLKKKKS